MRTAGKIAVYLGMAALLCVAQTRASSSVRVALPCEPAGSDPDTHYKRVKITNNWRYTIQSAETIYWKASDRDEGSINVTLPVGQYVHDQGTSEGGRGWTCKAYFDHVIE